MKKLPIGLQDFRELRKGNYLYVDKTQHLYELVNNGKYYFLSRPRRFGKSLMVSTLKYLYRAEQEAFKGLWIEDKWDWNKQHPVLHFSFSLMDYQGLGLEMALLELIHEQADNYAIKLKKKTLKGCFQELLKKLSKKGNVVLLIDEYDKPIIDYLGDENNRIIKHQSILKSFYSIIKDNDAYLEFLFITGISKFSKVGVFSDLNNLEDLTFDPNFSSGMGYTQEEIEHYFAPYLSDIQARKNLEKPALFTKMKDWYNGYSWDGETFVYNPFSILNFIKKRGKFMNYWFETGTPSFLIKILKNNFFYDFDGIQSGMTAFSTYDIEHLEELPLLFQTGYLTIKAMDEERDLYTLAYPNKEVRLSMLQHLVGAFSHRGSAKSRSLANQLELAFQNENIPLVISLINTSFASIPYPIFIKDKEAYYHSVVFLIFYYLGQYIESEVNTSIGRIDAVLETAASIYVIEFKLDKTAEEAIEQIKTKNYATKYQHKNKIIKLLGVNFSSETKAVENWLLEDL